MRYYSFIIVFLLYACSFTADDKLEFYDVIVVGGGASAVSAGLQSARSGARTLILKDIEWLGGMLTAAGVSAVDGNNNLPSGIWGEFRDSLVGRYGSRQALETGWVSNTLFEPHIGQRIFSNMVEQQENLEVVLNSEVKSVSRPSQHWHIKTKEKNYQSSVIIDATELGDIAKMVGIPYQIGMKDGNSERQGPQVENDIIQDLTWVAVLQDYGEGTDHVITKPDGYDPDEFSCACNTGDPKIDAVDCETMLRYGKLPGGKYMINWPNCGNDAYVNVLEMSVSEREKVLNDAKETTKRFVYYIQHELGFKHLGIANGVFPSEDGLALIPYHRESRRIEGEVRLLSDHLAKPYDYTLYRTGIAVGDYPIDHHHDKNPDAPEIDFIGIKVPAYSVPLGCLIPQDVDQFIVAEKSISVSNIVNGTTRLQPVVLGIGQAAGTLAALTVRDSLLVRNMAVREVQKELLDNRVYVMPFMDVSRDDPDFVALQQAGAMGLLQGKGVAFKWANQMWVYPDSLMMYEDLRSGVSDYGVQLAESEEELVTSMDLFTLIAAVNKTVDSVSVMKDIDVVVNCGGFLTRRQVARLVAKYTDLFHVPVDIQGKVKR